MNPINIPKMNNNRLIIDISNKSSDYYNNVCSKTTSKSGTDITLKDRRNEFVENNMTLCEEDCNLVDYNYTNQKAKCSCLVKISIPIINEIKFNKTRLYNSFTDVKNIANILILNCYNIVFKLKNLKSNIGFLFFVGIILLYIISLVIFVSKGFSSLIKIFYEIIQAKELEFKTDNKNQNKKKKENNLIKNNIKTLEKRKNNKYKNKATKKGKKKYKNFPPKKLRQINLKSEIKNNTNHKKKTNDALSLKKTKNKKTINNISSSVNQRILNNNNILFNNNNNMITNSINTKTNLNYNKILEKNDQELNSLKYKDALIHDRRTYIQYYISLLRANHLLIFSFYKYDKDYNSRIIKIFLFFFFFCVHFTVNALFFNDGTMHKIYLDEGTFNFIYQIPQIIYSAMISAVINIIIKFLSLSQKSIIEMKQEKNILQYIDQKKKLIKIMKIKFTFFFIITIFILLFFAYYITCFCGIYINTQIYLIKDTAISFSSSLLIPFIKYLIPGIFRFWALNDKKKNKECLYKFSLLIQSL